MNKQDWISAKISKLMKEGKKQDQAVAIAISMYNRMYQPGGQYNFLPKSSTFDETFPNQNKTGSAGVTPNYNMVSEDTDLVINPDQIVSNNTRDKVESVNFLKPMGMVNPSLDEMAGSNIGNFINSNTNTGVEDNVDIQSPTGKVQFFNPYGGVDLASAAGFLGQSIENKDTLGTVASGLKLATGIGRNVFGAIGEQRRYNQVMKDYYDRQREDLTRPVVAEEGGEFFQKGGKSRRFYPEVQNKVIDNTYVKSPKILPSDAPKRELSEADLKALSHQKRGMGSMDYDSSFVLNHNNTMNDLGYLSDSRKEELKRYMNSRGTFDKIYEGLPNFLVPFGISASEIPSDSVLRKEDGGYFEDGGKMTLPKALTGEFMTGMDENNPMMPVNAEIEKGEYVQNPNSEIQQVVGKTHEEGGENVNLEDGTKILSDHLKIGAVLAKNLKKEYDLDLKASDTYATVLDKYNKKVGLSKLVEEEEGFIEEIEKQKKETKNEQSLELNMQFLSEKINEISKKKQPLEEARKEVFNYLFEKQESSKPNDKKEGDYFEDGGRMIKEMADKYGVPYDRALEITKDFMQNGGYTNKQRQERLDNYYNQIKGLGYTGEKEIGQMQKWMVENHPKNVINYFTESGQPMTAKGIDLIKQNYPEAFSKSGISSKKPSVQYTPEEKKALQDTLGDKLDENFWLDQFNDNKFDWRFPTMTVDINSDTGNTDSGSKTTMPPVAVNTPTQGVVAPTDVNNKKDVVDNTDVMSFLLLPDQNPMLPNSLQSHLKINRRFDRISPALVSPEQNIQELNRSRSAITNEINNVPGAQRAAALIGLSANTDESINKILSETNRINSQMVSNAEARNATIQAMEENAAAQDALSYEQRQLRAQGLTDNDIRNYYNKLQDTNVRNYEKVNEMNLLNAMYNDFQFTGNTVEKTSPNIVFRQPQTLSLGQSNTKKKTTKKFGGRFNKY